MQEIIQKKIAVIYCRVSTKEQVDEGNSLVTQQKICQEYALKNGYEVIQVFIEQGESAKTQDRTQLQKLLSFCAIRRNKVNAVITYKIDRISRNTDDYSQIRILLKRYGVEIKSTSEYFENTPAGRFMENIIANVAQFDNDVRTERSIGGMRDAMREGRYVWLVPTGFDNTRIGGKATIAPNALAPLVRRTFEEIAKNLSPVDEVRRIMTKKGLTTNKGKPISKGYFYRMMKNELYAGWIKKFGERHKGHFEPIITDELFAQVQRVLTRRKHRGFEYQWENPDFPLRRFISHPSGKKLTGSWSQGRTKKYPYYRYSIPGYEISKNELEGGFKDLLECFEFNDKNYSKFKLQVKENLLKKSEEKRKDAKRLEVHIEELKAKQGVIIQKNMQGIISNEVLRQQSVLIEKEICDTQIALQEIPNVGVDIQEALEYASEYLRKPSKVWQAAPFDVKWQLQWFQFPQGITFDGKKFGTQEVSNLFKAKENFLPEKSPVVHFKLNTSNRIPKERVISTQGVAINGNSGLKVSSDPIVYWDSIGRDIIKLGEIMKQLHRKSKTIPITSSDSNTLNNKFDKAA